MKGGHHESDELQDRACTEVRDTLPSHALHLVLEKVDRCGNGMVGDMNYVLSKEGNKREVVKQKESTGGVVQPFKP